MHARDERNSTGERLEVSFFEYKVMRWFSLGEAVPCVCLVHAHAEV